MKKTILTKAVSAVLCASMAVSFASCATSSPKETDDVEETTLLSKPETEGATESSEETSETTAETTEATTEATTETTTEATTEATTTATTAPKVNPYERFIEDYINAIKDPSDTWYYGPDYDGDTVIPPEGTVGLLIVKEHEFVSYTLLDIDKDGTDELIFGSTYELEGDTYVDVTGVVTMTGEDEYKIVAAGWDRSTLTYAGGVMFVNSGSGGAALHIDTIYQYNSVTKSMDTVCELVTEYFEYNSDGIPVPSYSLFEGDSFHYDGSAYESEDATCHDEEALTRYTRMLDTAFQNKKDIPVIEWTKVPIN